MKVKFTVKGDWNNSMKFLKKISSKKFYQNIERYAQKGVEALARATPVDTGKTASSWGYEITDTGDTLQISWTNSNIVNYVPIAIILQYGHATRNGGWVEGRDYINPAIQPIFDEILKDVWREITR